MGDADAPKFLEQSVFYSGLTETSIREIQAAAREAATKELQRINALAREKQSSDKDQPEARSRFRFGMYFFGEDEPDTPSSSPDRKRQD